MVIPVFLTLILIIFSLKKASYGLMAYFFIRLCTPLSLRLFGFSFSVCCFTLLLILTLRTAINNYKWLSYNEKNFFKIFGILLSVLFILCLIPNVVPVSFQLLRLVRFIYTEILPACYIMVLIRNKKDFEKINRVILIAGIFTACYGIFTFASNSNPLYELFATDDTIIKDYSNNIRAGIQGRAVGIYNDKIFLSLVSLLFIIYFTGKEFLDKRVIIIFICLTLVDMVLTLQRTGLFAVILFALVLYSDKKYRKYFISSVTLCLVGFILLTVLSARLAGLKDYLVSSLFFWNDNIQSSFDVTGSSMGMRMSQFQNVIKYVDSHLLYGMGYSFSDYYYTVIWDRNTFGLDTEFYGFESFIFKVLISSGVLGLIGWSLFILRMFRLMQGNIQIKKNKYFLAFMSSYVLAIIMTDTSGSMFLFFTFVSLNILYHRFSLEEKVELKPSIAEFQTRESFA